MYRIRDYLSICCQKQRSTDPLIAKRSKINVKLNAIISCHLIGYDLLHADRCLQLISNSTRLVGNRVATFVLRQAIVATPFVSSGYRCHTLCLVRLSLPLSSRSAIVATAIVATLVTTAVNHVIFWSKHHRIVCSPKQHPILLSSPHLSLQCSPRRVDVSDFSPP
jgi:hypothetical protein